MAGPAVTLEDEGGTVGGGDGEVVGEEEGGVDAGGEVVQRGRLGEEG